MAVAYSSIKKGDKFFALYYNRKTEAIKINSALAKTIYGEYIPMLSGEDVEPYNNRINHASTRT